MFGETVTITKVVAFALEFLDTKPVGEARVREEQEAEQNGVYEAVKKTEYGIGNKAEPGGSALLLNS